MSKASDLRKKLRLPVIASPLFIISNPDLVIAQCKAGIVGSFPTLNARPAPMLEEWLKRITLELKEHDARHPDRPAAPFAVNQIVHRSNDRLAHDLEICTKYQVPIVITSLGAREDLNAEVHSYGGIVFHDVINQSFAKKAVSKGADGLILVAAGAGGHAGTTSPFAFVQETRQWFDGPIALSGSIASGHALPATVDRSERSRPRQPAAKRSVKDGLRLRRKHGQEGLERYLGVRAGHRCSQADHLGGRLRRSPRP